MGTTPIGFMNHFTNFTPDVESVLHFYIDFLGGKRYADNFRLHQVLLGGMLIDCFPPTDETPDDTAPDPGARLQQYRFSIDTEHVGNWVAHAEAWRMRTELLPEESLKRLTLLFDTPNGYHVGLCATYETVEALDEAVEELGARIERLNAVAEPFTVNSGPAVEATHV